MKSIRPFRSVRLALVAAAALWTLQGGSVAAEDLPIGVASSKNLVERTVVIDDQTFQVEGSTRIVDRQGLPMTFEQVKTEEDFGGLVPLDDVTYAYEANGRSLGLLKAVVSPR